MQTNKLSRRLLININEMFHLKSNLSFTILGIALLNILAVHAAAQTPGSLDSSFGNGGKVITPIGNAEDIAVAMALQSDGKIVTAGGTTISQTDVDFALARYNTDGSLDTSFGNGGRVITRIGSFDDAANAVAIQPDGKIVAAGISGSSPNYDFALIRYNTNGTLDTSFGVGGKVITPVGSGNDEARAVLIQSDGRIIAVGSTGNYPNTDFALVRYNTNGSLDTSFGVNGKVITTIGSGSSVDEARAAALQPDGRIVAAGHSYVGTQSPEFALARYNTDGSLDTSFGTGGKVVTPIGASGDTANAVAIQSDGKIVVAGYSSVGPINLDIALVRYNINGTLDNTFGTSGKVITPIGTSDEIANEVIIQPNGKIVAVGWSESSVPSYDFALVRYNMDGSLDTSFGVGGKVVTPIGDSTDFGTAAALQPDGKIVVAGYSWVGPFNFDFALARYLGDSNTRQTQFDFDGDGKADVSVFRTENGTWYLNLSASGFAGVQFGINTDKIVPADYDGDGKTDVAVFRNGNWYLQRSSLGFTGLAFGDANDIPVPADYDGDGRAEPAVFRPSNGAWYIHNLVNNQFTAVQFGQNGDVPVAADYDGDGKADVAVFRSGVWYIQRSQLGFTVVAFGQAGDKPVPADYDGDGKADVAVFRNGSWYLMRSQQGFTGIAFGLGTDTPVPADYDGDGKTDIAVFRNGTWYIQRSQSGFTGIVFGAANDKPIPNAFVS